MSDGKLRTGGPISRSAGPGRADLAWPRPGSWRAGRDAGSWRAAASWRPGRPAGSWPAAASWRAGRAADSGPAGTRAGYGWALPMVTAGLLAAACGGSTGGASHGAVHTAASKPLACGTAHTAAGVPVHIQVRHGHVSCTTALTVEKDYARAIAAGRAPGNGGGGPVRVGGGWTCRGYSTPVVLKTGDASACRQGTREILAVLPSTA